MSWKNILKSPPMTKPSGIVTTEGSAKARQMLDTPIFEGRTVTVTTSVASSKTVEGTVEIPSIDEDKLAIGKGTLEETIQEHINYEYGKDGKDGKDGKKPEVIVSLRELRIGKDGYEYGSRSYYGYEPRNKVFSYEFTEPVGPIEFTDTFRAKSRWYAKEYLKNKFKDHWFTLKFLR